MINAKRQTPNAKRQTPITKQVIKKNRIKKCGFKRELLIKHFNL